MIATAVELFEALQGTRLMALDCRYHGGTKVSGDIPVSIDLLLGDQLIFSKAIVKAPHIIGGLSLGSLLAIKTALAIPDIVKGLVLLRPAWPDTNCSTDFAAIKAVADSVFHPLLSQPCGLALGDLSQVNVPALVLGTPNDSRHPIAFARLVSNSLPNSVFYEVPDKNRDVFAYKDSVLQHTADFIAGI